MNKFRSAKRKNGSNCLGKCAKIAQNPRKKGKQREKRAESWQNAVKSDENAKKKRFRDLPARKKYNQRCAGANFLYSANWRAALTATSA